MARERGQATVELLAAIPLLLIAGAIALQLLLAGYALTLADGAAEAGALALATGQPAKSAAEGSLPAWAKAKVEVSVRGGEVSVRLTPPSLLTAVADRLAVSSSSYARPAGR
jgi:Flp pilus assembly protein TadG